jgi:hypothetical protein
MSLALILDLKLLYEFAAPMGGTSHPPHVSRSSLDHLVNGHAHERRNGEYQRFGGPEINYYLELRGLRMGISTGFCALPSPAGSAS